VRGDILMTPAITVGDLNSTERGTGARANGGKPAVELIPYRVIAENVLRRLPPADPKRPTALALLALGRFQERGAADDLHDAIDALGASWEDCAAVLEYGRRKYAAWNWARGMPWSVCLGCAGRHCLAILRGEEADPESGLPHRAHVLCNLVFLLHYVKHYSEGDDRMGEECVRRV